MSADKDSIIGRPAGARLSHLSVPQPRTCRLVQEWCAHPKPCRSCLLCAAGLSLVTVPLLASPKLHDLHLFPGCVAGCPRDMRAMALSTVCSHSFRHSPLISQSYKVCVVALLSMSLIPVTLPQQHETSGGKVPAATDRACAHWVERRCLQVSRASLLLMHRVSHFDALQCALSPRFLDLRKVCTGHGVT